MTTRMSSVLMAAAAMAISLSPAQAAPDQAAPPQAASSHAGGYGPIRLGMAEADAQRALPNVAHDISILSMDAMSSYDAPTLSKMAVAVPWEDSDVGRLDPSRKIQFGVDDGQVITVFLRTSTGDAAPACRNAFTALVKRNEAEFGALEVTGDQDDPAASIAAKGDFNGWTLFLNGMEMEDGKCSLTADYISDKDKMVEQNWRDGMRPKG